jgi:CheY-like chemotaxis protein
VFLLIEDDETTRDTTAAVLRYAGHTVRTAANGHPALAMLESEVPSVIRER